MLGQGQVIKGWDEGVAGDESRRQTAVCASHRQLAYGDPRISRSHPGGLDADFDVELMKRGESVEDYESYAFTTLPARNAAGTGA